VPARVAKVGVLRYQDADGNTWGELVPEGTLFAADSMATLCGVAVTDLHPAKPVTAETRRTLQRGHVGDTVTRDGDYLRAPVYVTDGDAIALVQSGQRRDVSCGYECELDETPGSYNGVPYDRVQRDRVYNHLGIGPEGWGRAGTDVSLKMDGAGEPSALSGLAKGAAVARLDSGDSHASPAAQEPLPGAQKTSASTDPTGRAAPITAPEKGQRSAMAQPKTNAKKDGDEMPPKDAEKDTAKKDMDPQPGEKIDSPDLGAQLDAANNALMEAMKTIAMLKAQLAVTEATKPEVTEENVPEMIADSIVAKRLAKLVSATTDAKIVAHAVKLDGLVSTRKVHEAALSLVVPEMKFDGLTDDRVAGMFDALAATAKKAAEKGEKSEKRQDSKSVRNDALGAAHRVIAEPGEKPADSVEDAIRKMHQDSCDDWKRATPALRVPTTIKAD